MFTGKGREEVAIKALNLGADYYIKKGFDAKSQFTELYHIIKNVINHRKVERALFESEKRYRELIETIGEWNLSKLSYHLENAGSIPEEYKHDASKAPVVEEQEFDFTIEIPDE